MDSGSGKNQDDTETKEPVDSLRQREESAAAAADADAESPPLPPQPEITQVEGHGPPEAEGRNPSADTATAAAAEQKGKAVQKAEETSLFWSAWGSAGDKPALPPRPPTGPDGGKPPLPPRPPFVSGAGGQSSASIDLKDVFNELMLESQMERTGETDQKDEAEGMPKQQLTIEQAKSLALWPKKGKKSLWRKALDRIGVSNRKYTLANMNCQKVRITELIRHYNLHEMVAGRGVEFHTNALNLRNAYFAFRPVRGDGECFYRSFIFSYLEQVLDRQDTHEEHRVLAAVKGVARQHARLGWTSKFPRSHKAFKKLIKKVMSWKTHRRWNNSYRLEKLLEVFNDYKRTDDIFTFLRLVAAIWICSHSEEFVPLIPELNEDHTLTEWCFQEVIQPKVFRDQNSTDDVSNNQLTLPDELLWDIFLQLPVSDIHHCLRVCRQFRNLIRQECFQHQHAQLWSPRILIYHKPDAYPDPDPEVFIYEDEPHLVESFNITTREVSPFLQFTCYPYHFDDPMGIWIQGSCDGVVLLSFEEELCVWSPWTGWWGHLAPIHLENVIVAFYGHSQGPQQSAKEYVILCRTRARDRNGSYWIVSLGKSGFNAAKEIGYPMVPGSPLELGTNLRRLPSSYHGPPTLINGFLFWLLPPYFQVNYLITFDTMLEVFGAIDIPDTGLLPYQLAQVQGRVAIAFFSQTMDSIDVWLLLNSQDGWARVHNVGLPVAEIQAMRGLNRFREPVVYIVPESLDILVWTPEFLMVVDHNGLVLEYHQHHQDWIMLSPHILEVRFEQNFLSGPEDVMRKFFRFPADFSLPESSTGEIANQQTAQGCKLSSCLSRGV